MHVEWSPDDGPDVDLAALSTLAHVDAATYLPELSRLLPETLIMPVGNGRLVTADLRSESCWDGLSALGLDVALVGRRCSVSISNSQNSPPKWNWFTVGQ